MDIFPYKESERRFYLKDFEGESQTAEIAGDEYRHIIKALRLRAGDGIVIFNGDGYDYFGQIAAITSNTVFLNIIKKEKNACEPKIRVTLFQAMPKGDKADFITQKAVELGLSQVVFFDSEHTVKKQKDGKSDRFTRIAAEAAKQCGRASVPEIVAGISFKQAVTMLESFNLRLFANEREHGQSLADILPQGAVSGRVALIIGSEGGFSEGEAKILTESGAKSFTLGRRILRAETAAVAVPAIVMCALGELS